MAQFPSGLLLPGAQAEMTALPGYASFPLPVYGQNLPGAPMAYTAIPGQYPLTTPAPGTFAGTYQVPSAWPSLASQQTVPAAPSGPKKPDIPIWQQPTPFTREEIAELQATKPRFGTPIYFPNVLCSSCTKPVSLDKFNRYRELVDSGMPEAQALDELGIERCCRIEYRWSPEIPRGNFLLPQEKQAGNEVNPSPGSIVVETRQQPIRPPAGGRVRVINSSTLKKTLVAPQIFVVQVKDGRAESVRAVAEAPAELAPGERVVTAVSSMEARRKALAP